MLDSPYVRRVAISLRFLGLPFAHEPVSVFRHFDQFASINPVVKAPTLVIDDGTVLMESSLILEHAERLALETLRLAPSRIADHGRAQRIIGLALAACEKTVQIVYEYELRPQEKQHQPWLDRVGGQLSAAYRLLEAEVGRADTDDWLFGSRPLQADITAAVAWRFTREMLRDVVRPQDHPAVAKLSARAEALPEFLASPFN
jgi:glutathione S-transferase